MPTNQLTARRLPAWAKVLIGIVIAAIVPPLGVGVVFVWSFSGGWDGIRPQPQPDDRARRPGTRTVCCAASAPTS